MRFQLTRSELLAARGHRDRPPEEGYALDTTHLSSDPNSDTQELWEPHFLSLRLLHYKYRTSEVPKSSGWMLNFTRDTGVPGRQQALKNSGLKTLDCLESGHERL